MNSRESRKNPREQKGKKGKKGRILPSKKLPIPDQETPSYLTIWPMKDILTMKRNHVIKDPLCQRKPDIWDANKKMKPGYIVTILERRSSDPVRFQETPKGELLRLNGQQRIDTAEAFYKNKFAIPNSVDPERADMKFKGLTEAGKKTFLNYRVTAIVTIASNGKGMIDYKNSNTNIPIGHSEIIKADYYDTKFYKDIQSILRYKGFFKVFFYHSGVLSPATIRRGKDEEFLGDCCLLAVYGACDGKEFINKLSDFKRKPSLYNDFKKQNYEQKLGTYILYLNRIFPKGLKGTHFDNLSGCYRLLGAIKSIIDEGNEKIFTKAKYKRIARKLETFVSIATRKGRRGLATGVSAKYYATLSRSTRDKSVRLEGIKIIRNQIMTS